MSAEPVRSDGAIQDSAAEAFLLGAAMSGYPEIDALDALVKPADFYLPLNEAIWTAILTVHRSGNQPEALSVREALTVARVAHDPARLFEYIHAVPMASQAPYYAGLVAVAAGKRRLQVAGIKIQQLGGAPDQDLDGLQDHARVVLDDATVGRLTTAARTMVDILPGVIDTAQHGRTLMLSSGWPDLDRIIGGLAPGRLIVVGARPGVGKSVMGTNLALHMAGAHDHAVLLSSLEMPESEVGQRLLAAYASANLTGLQNGRTDERTWNLIAEKTGQLNALPITVDDTPGQTVTDITRAARAVMRTRPDLALIVVDYLQLVRPLDARVNRAEALGEISRGLKLLARETGACVVAMAQVNREGTKHSDGRPRMTDLRESGSIEADADQVVLLHQPDEEIPEIEVLVDKNRHGPKGACKLHLQGHYARLVSVEWPQLRMVEP